MRSGPAGLEEEELSHDTHQVTLIERHDNVQWRAVATKETLINYFLFSTFHGGHTRDWAPKDKEGNSVAVHALFDNIAVYPGKHVRKSPGKDW